jgi:pyruvate-formate lyase-activating enzyme
MKMKRVLAFVLATMMLLSLASCSGKVSRGTTMGSTYKNDGVGIKFTAPEGWDFLKDDELAVEMNTGSKSFKEQLANGVAYDAVAKNEKTGNMVIISFVDLEKKYANKEMTVEELLPMLLEDKEFYETSGGGVTLSGGECLCQADFCAELLKKLKENGINTAVDNCGFVP